MTVGQAISKVRGVLKKTTGDNMLSKRLIYSILSSSLNTLLERNKDQLYRSDMYVTARLTPERVLLSEVSCVPLDCEVCRVKLIDPIYTKSGPIIRWVGPENLNSEGNSQFRIVTPSQFQNKIKLNPNGSYAFIEDGYLYLQECLPCVKVVYMSNSSTSSDSCSKLDAEFNVPNFLEDAVFKLTYQDLSYYLQTPFDVTQNKNPNS